jgi:hypothetical protein
MSFQEISTKTLQNSIQSLLTLYIECNARNSAEFLSALFFEHYQQHSSKISNYSPGGNVTLKSAAISTKLLYFLEYLDQVSVSSYLLFNENPPVKTSHQDIRRQATTRQSITMGNTSNNLALQMDIERLFSQRVKVFTPCQPNSGPEYVIGAILKVRKLSLSFIL